MDKKKKAVLASLLPVLSLAAAILLYNLPVTVQYGGDSGFSYVLPEEIQGFDYSDIPEYSGSPWTEVNGDVPFFVKDDLTSEAFETYSELDPLGRCGTAYSCIGKELMPTEERGPIGMIKPSGWHTVRYAGIEGNYLYNRCHLIGYQLTGENANEKNLITGTRYMNIEGMLPIENMTAEHIRKTGDHVLYRVTPVFEGGDLLCRGVLMEGYSAEDSGSGVCFCRFVYNVQPGVTIDYSDGSSSGPPFDDGGQ